MTLELSMDEAKMLMMHLNEEAFQVEELAKIETGLDKENLCKEAKMMIDISNRIKKIISE